MNNTKTLLALLSGSLAASVAHAQVEITITGSTAFRSISIDRSAALYDAGSRSSITNDATTGLITFSGTMSNKVASLGSTPVKVRLSFSGSASGMLSVKNSTPVSTAETAGVNVNKIPDLALSDVFPSSATPPISDNSFNRAILGVIPFLWVKNNALSGIVNITREQAVLLFTASGEGGMPATYLGGSSSNPVYLIGRDPGSGTRITVHKDVGFNSLPTYWATNGAGMYVQTNGYSSGGLQRGTIAAKSDAIGYLGRADLLVVSASVSAISYEGVAFSPAAVTSGKYPIWGYEHIVNRAGGLSANQVSVRNALIAAITDAAFQATPVYSDNFVSLSDMEVERGTDGGTITSILF